MQGLAFVLVKFHKAPVDPFPQPVRVPLDDSPAPSTLAGPPNLVSPPNMRVHSVVSSRSLIKDVVSCPGANTYITKEGWKRRILTNNVLH